MGKFIIGTFAILAWTFYVLSGGADFVPETQLATAEEPAAEVTRAEGVDIAVTRPAPAPAQPEVIEVAAPAPPETAGVDPDQAETTALETAQIPAEQPRAVEAAFTAAPRFEGTTVGVNGIDNFTSLAAPAPAAVASPDLLAIREVAARAVNMREGPDTSYAVLDTLPQGTQTEVLESSNTGWVRVRVLGTGQVGWMAERLLTSG